MYTLSDVKPVVSSRCGETTAKDVEMLPGESRGFPCECRGEREEAVATALRVAGKEAARFRVEEALGTGKGDRRGVHVPQLGLEMFLVLGEVLTVVVAVAGSVCTEELFLADESVVLFA